MYVCILSFSYPTLRDFTGALTPGERDGTQKPKRQRADYKRSGVGPGEKKRAKSWEGPRRREVKVTLCLYCMGSEEEGLLLHCLQFIGTTKSSLLCGSNVLYILYGAWGALRLIEIKQ